MRETKKNKDTHRPVHVRVDNLLFKLVHNFLTRVEEGEEEEEEKEEEEEIRRE